VNETSGDRSAGCTNWYPSEKDLLQKLYDAQSYIHLALCDNIDTPKTLSRLLNLINESNIYIAERGRERRSANTGLLQKIAGYVARILKVIRR
jgi:cysteinyl-tRNA synthetase